MLLKTLWPLDMEYSVYRMVAGTSQHRSLARRMRPRISVA